MVSIFRVENNPIKRLAASDSLTCLLHVEFNLGILFDPEDGDDLFLRNLI
jgi:hypothetical protein